jgi:hypothetical protein
MLMTYRDPEALAKELVEIYRKVGFMTLGADRLEEWNSTREEQGLVPLSPDTLAQFDADNQNIRGKEIGVILNELGGQVLMVKVAEKVVNTLALGSIVAREFDAIWDGIGTWRF